MKKELIMKNSNLNKLDTEDQTYGCRHSNPDICSYNGLAGVCAFCSKDSICKRPPRSWKKMYQKLKEEII